VVVSVVTATVVADVSVKGVGSARIAPGTTSARTAAGAASTGPARARTLGILPSRGLDRANENRGLHWPAWLRSSPFVSTVRITS
jgi:hypothetical protein